MKTYRFIASQFVKLSLCILTVQLWGEDIRMMWLESGIQALPLLEQKLKTGTPEEKEQVLLIVMEYKVTEMIESVISALLDDTLLPRNEDTGWGSAYHLAANVLCKLAEELDGKNQKERGWNQYTFYNEGGIADKKKRGRVHYNWKRWWEKNKYFFAAGIYTREGWIGEGKPVLIANKELLKLYKFPSYYSLSYEITYSKNKQIDFKRTKVVTINPVILKVKKLINDVSCSGKTFYLNPNAEIEYLQPVAEGFGIVRIDDMICEIFMMDKDLFEGFDKTPQTEWWVQVLDDEKNPIGWLAVENEQVIIQKRKF
jgi:hypothetical protein